MKDKPLIHTVEENRDAPHYHNVSGENFFEGSRIIDSLFVIKQLKDGWEVTEYCTPRNRNYSWACKHILLVKAVDSCRMFSTKCSDTFRSCFFCTWKGARISKERCYNRAKIHLPKGV